MSGSVLGTGASCTKLRPFLPSQAPMGSEGKQIELTEVTTVWEETGVLGLGERQKFSEVLGVSN